MDFKKFSNLIMIEQTLFALPFAYIGILFAGGAEFQTWLLATIALVSARTSGMLFNRVLDSDIDTRNPRTADRLLPKGLVKKSEVWTASIISSAVFIFSAYLINDLCFYLSFPALFMLITYSLFKRFTSASHFYLGFVEAAAPIGGYLSVTGEFSLTAFLPAAAIMFWIAGIDILYSIQDMKFDRDEKLFSISSRFGLSAAYGLSRLSYIISLTALILGGIILNAGFFYYVSLSIIAVIFIIQQDMAEDLSSINQKMVSIFSLNKYISIILLVGLTIDRVLK